MKTTWTALLATLLLAGCIPVPVPLHLPEPQERQSDSPDGINAALEADAQYFRTLAPEAGLCTGPRRDAADEAI